MKALPQVAPYRATLPTMMFSAAVEGAVLGRIDHQLAAGEALAEVVVGVPLQLQGQALGQEGAEGLAAAAGTLDGEGVLRQAHRRGAG